MSIYFDTNCELKLSTCKINDKDSNTSSNDSKDAAQVDSIKEYNGIVIAIFVIAALLFVSLIGVGAYCICREKKNSDNKIGL